MNIDEYRALKTQMEENPEGNVENAQTQLTSNGQTVETKPEESQVPSDSQEETKPTENSAPTDAPKEEVVEDNKPQTIEIDGKEIPIDELKSGYLRQSDYTRKTQEIKRKEQQAEEALKLIEQLQANPQIAQQLSQAFEIPNLDPAQAKYTDLENRYYDLLIEKEISELTTKYGDFDVREVLEFARDKNLSDLDTAYHVVQSRKGGGAKSFDVETLKEQLREELMSELKSQQETVDTNTIIQTSGDSAPVRDTRPQLSQQEFKVAKMMGMNAEEYAKWRNVKK